MPEIILFQTADQDRYFPMLMATLPANRAFCLRRGIRMEVFIGVRRGFHPWQAAYNRLGFLADRLAEDYRGWVVHLDADAFIADQRFDLAGYLAGHQDAGHALIHPPGSRQAAWDVNSGVFLWDLGQEAAREAARRWIAAFAAIPDAALRQAGEWNEVENDQRMLQRHLRDDPALLAALHIEADALIGYQHSRFIKQFVTNDQHSLEQRTDRIAQAVARVMPPAWASAPAQAGGDLRQAAALLRNAEPEALQQALPKPEAAQLAVAMAELLRG
ncbi:hypothetical protein HB662_20575 [Roseomonas frigidaquae]|uniref:DUF5672 domain-containing protein n=1 Tax=Falsiroseomonas frigidaquae TaxID=487318 RepID=A0ABX1F4G8_9PROT|nr:hypothetical protein [Falsiroseomonas frigidaquae]NKE47185.1 hypothetical protein [Falsiroseomonas frigidaquae]